MQYDYVKIHRTPDEKKLIVVDFNPPKTCNFNCLHCTLGPTTNFLYKRKMFFEVDDILIDVQKAIEQEGLPTQIILTGSGEPSLYAGFGQLEKKIKGINSEIKTKVITNGSFLTNRKVRKELSQCDSIQLNLDSIIKEEHKKIGQYNQNISLDSILKGALKLRKKYSGELTIKTKIMDGYNNSLENIDKLRNFMELLQPTNVDIITAKPFNSQNETQDIPETDKQLIKDIWRDAPFEVSYNF